jgi:pimeloyl-ACP methyl ester carboxylesterase
MRRGPGRLGRQLRRALRLRLRRRAARSRERDGGYRRSARVRTDPALRRFLAGASRRVLARRAAVDCIRATPARDRRGIVNFVGGWHGDTCPNDFNRYVFRRAGAAVTVPTLWLYTENDRYYSPRSIRAYANEFESAGGRVTLRVYPPQGADGHYLTRHPDVWRGDLESFLDRLGLPARP